MSDGIILRCTSAFTLNGGIVKPGDLVEVTASEAANLLHRGRAELTENGGELEKPAVLGTQTAKPAKKGGKARKAEPDDADDDGEGGDA